MRTPTVVRRMLGVLWVAGCQVGPAWEGGRGAALSPAVCEKQAYATYTACLTDCNRGQRTEEQTRDECLTQADLEMRTYLRGLVDPLVALDDLEEDIPARFGTWSREREACGSAAAEAGDHREACAGRSGLPGLELFRDGCFLEQDQKYSECLGTCENGATPTQACAPYAGAPWLPCGVWRLDDEGECRCDAATDGALDDESTLCGEYLDALDDDPRFDMPCTPGAGASGAWRWTFRVAVDELRRPVEAGSGLVCTRFDGDTPSFETEPPAGEDPEADSCGAGAECAPGEKRTDGCDPCAEQVCGDDCTWAPCALATGHECLWEEGTNWRCCAGGGWQFCLPDACVWSEECELCTGCGC